MTQRELAAAHDRSSAAAAQRTSTPAPELHLCVHRSDDSIGKVRCSCATAPEVYRCAHAAIVSHFCTPILPQKPGDGPIVFHDGRTTEERYLPYPLEPDDKPRRRDVICCSSCPHRQEPGPERLAALRAGVLGTDSHGRCEMLHLLDHAAWPSRHKLAAGAMCLMNAQDAWLRAVEVTVAQVNRLACRDPTGDYLGSVDGEVSAVA
jgi:hypothetical protein